MKQIILPDHPDMVGTRICYRCNGHMKPCTTSNTYHLTQGQLHVCNIKAFRCVECGEEIYSGAEGKMIEGVLRAHREGKFVE